ncbi:MAG: PQQ-binding-like beta-propeller repeat protein [Thermoanaerobaculia bacterium]|nr:PQQ-binding-like beta-propeller repeat protein [Thermoanaerobaculia bacterium]
MSPIRTLALLLFALLASIAPAVASGPSAEERLWQAARDGDVETIRELLAAGVPVDARSEFDATALYFAANANQAEAIRVLAEAGADVNAGDSSYGFAAISMAGWLGNREAVGALLDVGASPEDAVGAFFAGASNGHAHVVEEIASRGLVAQPMLDAALRNARHAGAEAVVAVLLAAGARGPQADPSAQAAGEEAESGEAEPDADGGAAAAGSASEAAPVAAARAGEAAGQPQPDPGAVLARPLTRAAPANWPEFRGPGRSGVADGQLPPLSWDLDSGANVAWSAPVDGLGLSSPTIWEGQIFVTTAVSPETRQTLAPSGRGTIDTLAEEAVHRWQVRSYDLDTGELIWARTARTGVPRSKRHWKASQANPSCAVDGERVVASFGSEGVYAFTLDGDLLWQRDLGRLNAGWYVDEGFEWGYASSPALHDGRVFLQVDVHGQSFVTALDAATGETLWRTERDEIPSWGTPLVVERAGGDELVLSASKAIVGYDADTGEELWRIEGNSLITVASPIAGDGFVLVTGGYREPKPIYLVRPGARGTIQPDAEGRHEHLVWSRQTDGVYGPTPLYYRGVLYLHRDNGVLSALDPSTGEEHYKERVGGHFTASPVAADGRIYLTAEDGTVTVLAAGPEYRVLTENELDAATLATPAISAGKVVFRTVAGLVAVGHADADPAPAGPVSP